MGLVPRTCEPVPRMVRDELTFASSSSCVQLHSSTRATHVSAPPISDPAANAMAPGSETVLLDVAPVLDAGCPRALPRVSGGACPVGSWVLDPMRDVALTMETLLATQREVWLQDGRSCAGWPSGPGFSGRAGVFPPVLLGEVNDGHCVEIGAHVVGETTQ